MKKIIIGLVILLAAAGACAPFVSGLVMEKTFRQYQDDLNAMNAVTGSGITFDIIRYDRNFSSSEVEWRIHLGSLAALYGVEEIILVDHAKHGFTGVVTKTSLEKNPWFADLLNNSLNGKNPLDITTTYTLLGTVRSIVDIHPFSFQVENDVVEFQPGRMVTECDGRLTHLSSAATWGGLSVPGKLSMDGFSMTSDLEKISPYIWAGDISYALNSFSIEEKGNNIKLLQFKGGYTLDYNDTAKKLSTGGEIEIGSIETAKEEVKDSFVRVEVNNIDAQGYENFMNIYTRTMHSALDDIKAANQNPDETKQALQDKMATLSMQMMAAYEKLLKKGLQIKISDLRAEFAAGKVTGNFALELTRDVTFAQLAPIAMQPDLAFDIFSLQSDLSFPAELVGDKTRLLSPVFPGMQTGFFVEEGDKLVHRARTQNGKLLLNGSEVVFR